MPDPNPSHTIHLDEPRATSLTLRYQPDEESVWENPPRFAWLPTLDESQPYVLRIGRDEQYTPAATTTFADIRRTYFVPHASLKPGSYWWSYAVWDAATKRPASRWSQSRTFTVPDGLAELPLPSSTDRLRRASTAHPRLWLGAAKVTAFAAKLKTDPNHCGFAQFYERAVKPFIDKPITAEPTPYPNNKKTAPLWRQIYIDCQEVLYAVRHLAIAGRLLGDTALTARSKQWLMAAAGWDVNGTSSRAYNDEAAFRIIAALAWGYDWLHDDLTTDERAIIRTALLARTRDMARHVFGHARIQVFPYDSHAVRFLSAALIPACIALLHDEPEAQVWLDETVEYLFSIYSPWGGKDGGWAEGPHYWTLGLAYLLDAAGLLKNYLGVDLLARPFFQATLDFPLYTKGPGTRRVSFGDDSTMGDLPSLKVGYNVRRLALASGNADRAGWGQWYYEQLKRDDPGTAHLFYNYGWWDFDFEEMVVATDGIAHNLPDVAAKPPTDMPAVRVFNDVGWAAVQAHMDDPARQFQLVFKSSPYGSLSHSHGDQNAFLLRAYGEDLASQSGHYVAFNSQMHQQWRRQTRSKNALLIGGPGRSRGQYAGADKARGKATSGRITDVRETPEAVVIVGDATAAYRSETPHVDSVRRELHVVGKNYLVVVDQVALSEATPITWLLHTDGALTSGGQTFRLTGQRAGLYGQFVYCTAGQPTVRVIEGFPGIDDAELTGLARHRHIAAETPPARHISLVTLLVPYPLSAPARVLHFIDDQGHGVSLSFVDGDGREYKVSLGDT
jgi:Domain of unknown function (DUF4962)/Heparinase II/III-like protein